MGFVIDFQKGFFEGGKVVFIGEFFFFEFFYLVFGDFVCFFEEFYYFDYFGVSIIFGSFFKVEFIGYFKKFFVCIGQFYFVFFKFGKVEYVEFYCFI